MKPTSEPAGADDTPKMLVTPEGPDRSAEERSAEIVADDLLVHALLRGRFEDTPATMQSRVDRVCLSFASAPRILRWPWRTGLSTAAAAVIVVGLILIFSSPQDVQADFGQVLDAFDVGDKTYQIEVGDQLRLARRPSRPGRRRGGRGGRGAALQPSGRGALPRRLDGALLYTRSRQYVLVCNTPSGRKITKGFDGQRSWLTHPWRQPRMSTDPNLLQADIPEDIVSLLFLDLRDILHQVRANYKLHELADAEAPNGRVPVRHFVAERRSRQATLPQRIELWFDPETDQLEQILCVEAGLRRGRQRRQTLRISLVDTDPLPAEWFTAGAHLSETPAP